MVDTAGRMTSATGRTYTWTPLDRLATATVGSTSASYGYDGWGHRVRSTVNGTARYFVNDAAGHVLAEYNGAGNLLVEHVYLGDQRIGSRAPNGSRAYFQNDVLGSAWITTADTGWPYEVHDYWPFGEAVGQFEGPAGPQAPEVLCQGANPLFCNGFESGDFGGWTCSTNQGCTPEPGEFFEPL